MTALPDTIMPERGRPPMMEITLPDGMDSTHLIKVVVWRFLSVVSLLAAIGVWIVPSAPQDTLMPLIKLVFSVGFAGGALYFITAMPQETTPEITIDPRNRRISMCEYDAKGTRRKEIVHDFDMLSDVVLRDGWLTAQDVDGRRVLSLPVRDPSAVAALREAFAPTRA